MQTRNIKAAASNLRCPFSQQDQAVSAAADLKHAENTGAHEHLPCGVIARGCVGDESFALCAGSDAEDAPPVQNTVKMASEEVGANAAHVHTKLSSGAAVGGASSGGAAAGSARG